MLVLIKYFRVVFGHSCRQFRWLFSYDVRHLNRAALFDIADLMVPFFSIFARPILGDEIWGRSQVLSLININNVIYYWWRLEQTLSIEWSTYTQYKKTHWFPRVVRMRKVLPFDLRYFIMTNKPKVHHNGQSSLQSLQTMFRMFGLLNISFACPKDVSNVSNVSIFWKHGECRWTEMKFETWFGWRDFLMNCLTLPNT